jgi:hypothetical protein
MLEAIFIKLGVANGAISASYFTIPTHQSVCLYICMQQLSYSVLGNGSASTLPQQRIRAAVEKLLDSSFCM